MKKQLVLLLAGLALVTSPAFAQSLDVTETGVNVDTDLNVTGTVTAGDATVGSLSVGASTIFTEGSFESAELTIPGGGNTLTVAHGLGGVPRFSTISLRCINSQFGWDVGDEILLSSVHMRSDNHGFTAASSQTGFKLRQKGSIYIHRRDTNETGAISAENWRLIFRAWR